MSTLPNTDPVWTNDDWLAGHCSCAEIGLSKYTSRSTLPDVQRASPIVSPPPSEEELAADLARYNQAVLRVAREEYNGDYDAFLRANPYVHHKSLLNLQRQSFKPPTSGPSKLEVHLNWVGPNRLSYRQDLEKAIEVDPDKEKE